MVDDIVMGKDREAVEVVLQKVRADMRRFTRKSDISLGVGSTSATVDYNVLSAEIPKREDLTRYYDQLLAGRVNDEKIRNKIIRYAEIMMQENTFCDINLICDNGDKFSIKVLSCLPEHRTPFVLWWQDKVIDSPGVQLNLMVEDFRKAMSSYNIGAILIQNRPGHNVRISDVKTDFYMVF
jgi:hypothetical protein